MKQFARYFLERALRQFNVGICNYARLQTLRDVEKDFDALITLPPEVLARLTSLVEKSRAQLRQDLFVLATTKFKRDGYFVEFGATNGVELSNTYLLEKEFGWSGILAEPASCWHAALRDNRRAHIETSCVWRDSNSTLMFNEVAAAELSTIETYSKSDAHAAERDSHKSYSVKTISLNDLLEKYGAPTEVDYLSIDTEGSEYEILSAFDFGRRSFKIITCEHNFTPKREQIFDLLTRNGYARTWVGLSKWDDWYVRKD